MAAQEYYSQGWSSQNHGINAPLPPLPTGSQSSSGPTNIATPASSNSSPFDDHTYVYPSHAQESQQSLAVDTGYYGNNGKPHVQDEYADNIPLKPQQQPSPYSPGGDDQLPGPLGDAGGGKRKKRNKLPVKKTIPWFVYVATAIQIGVFIGELIKNAILTKTPIAIHPQFNPMIGPSPYVLINMGARYVPCMRFIPGVQDATWPCPNTTTSNQDSPSNQCKLTDLCGFGATNGQPNQWFRFIVPMFLHAGIIHIGFNMLLQVTLGRDMEQAIGTLRFALVYLSSGIFGFVLGGNFAPDGIASTGASGSLFGILALVLLDILYTWKDRKSPKKDLAFIALDVVISFVLGLLPGLDNFSHIGGFVMGLALGLCLLRSPNVLRQRIGDDPPYTPVSTVKPAVGFAGIAKKPVGFFKGRKPLWWAWWLLRAAALVAVLIGFIVLLNNFYKYRVKCSWCKHLSCLPISNWCDLGNLHFVNSTTNNKRDLFSPVSLEAFL
ncbi:hypothetical protein GP486_005135 [Trichoglossum hirsutum]|uniref:Rhomboid-type serine protease n=1 Tax=Trichoglossum hirsutum TaxID=265104 RepID=A0A9P8L9T7_9PEZI|nr:hypothetical protein GP486_005135 [Trichoglossum hirsutum]